MSHGSKRTLVRNGSLYTSRLAGVKGIGGRGSDSPQTEVLVSVGGCLLSGRPPPHKKKHFFLDRGVHISYKIRKLARGRFDLRVKIKEDDMRKRLRFFTAISFMLAALFALALTPVWADSVEDKIKALENELSSLKAEQAEIKRDVRAQAPAPMIDMRYRPGRGLNIRGADRSWDFTLGYEGQGHMSFFPGSARSIESTDGDGPSQGAMKTRHNEFSLEFEWMDGLYGAGSTFRFDSRIDSKSRQLFVNFGTFSPYYPLIEFLHTSARPFFDPVYNSSSTSGTTLDRAAFNDSLYSTASTKGIGLIWEDVPLGMGDFTTGVIYNTTYQLDSHAESNSNTQRGFITGINARPFRGMKDSPLAGWSLGYGFIRDHTYQDDEFYDIEIGPTTNGVSIVALETKGARWNHAVWTQYSQGPIRAAASYNWHKAERDFRDGEEGDFKANVLLLRTGLFVWGPNGFLTGDENGGLMVAFNHFRNFVDAGSGFDVRNEFDEMRRYNFIQNIGLLRWFIRPNIVTALEYQANKLSKMRGGGDAEDARRRLGIRESGGTSQAVTLALKMNF